MQSIGPQEPHVKLKRPRDRRVAAALRAVASWGGAVTVGEAARRLGTTPERVWDATRNRHLPFVLVCGVTLILKADVEAYRKRLSEDSH